MPLTSGFPRRSSRSGGRSGTRDRYHAAQTAIAAARVLPSRRAGIAETLFTRGDTWLSPRKPSRS
jgi:hypothetical protein